MLKIENKLTDESKQIHFNGVIDCVGSNAHKYKQISIIAEIVKPELDYYYVTIFNEKTLKKVSILFDVNDSYYLCSNYIKVAIMAC